MTTKTSSLSSVSVRATCAASALLSLPPKAQRAERNGNVAKAAHYARESLRRAENRAAHEALRCAIRAKRALSAVCNAIASAAESADTLAEGRASVQVCCRAFLQALASGTFRDDSPTSTIPSHSRMERIPQKFIDAFHDALPKPEKHTLPKTSNDVNVPTLSAEQLREFAMMRRWFKLALASADRPEGTVSPQLRAQLAKCGESWEHLVNSIKALGARWGFSNKSAEFRTDEGSQWGIIDLGNEFVQEFLANLLLPENVTYRHGNIKGTPIADFPLRRTLDNLKKAYRGTGIGRETRVRNKSIRTHRWAKDTVDENRTVSYISAGGGNVRDYAGSAKHDATRGGNIIEHFALNYSDVEASSLRNDVQEAIDSLPSNQRQMAQLLLSGMEEQTIAQTLTGKTGAAAKSWASRNLPKLRNALRAKLSAYAAE